MVFSRRKSAVAGAALFVVSALLLASCESAPSSTSTASTNAPPSTTTISSLPTSPSGDSTTSSTLLFPSEQAFKRELSGDGYRTTIVFVDQREGVIFTMVWVAVDLNNASRPTDDVIFDQAVAVAAKYGTANATDGRLKVELYDASGAAGAGLIRDHIFESRDFDLGSTTSPEPNTVATKLFPAIDEMLAMLRLDVNPRKGIRVAVGGLREVPSDGLDARKRLIEGEIIIENHSATAFACGPDDFRLYVGPFQTQMKGLTASTDFPVQDAVLAPTSVEGHEFMSEGVVPPGSTLHGYLLTWIADRGTESYGLQYDPSDAEARKVSRDYMSMIQP